MAKQEVEPDFLAPFITQVVFEEQLPPGEEAGVVRGDSELHSSTPTTGKKSGQRVMISASAEFSFTRQRAHLLRQMCLTDFKQRMVDIANLIQAKFEKVAINFFVPLFMYTGNSRTKLLMVSYCCNFVIVL